MSRGRGPRRAWLLGVALAVPIVGACSSGAGPRTSCGGDGTGCLTGTVTVTGFTAVTNQLQLSLFREFPSAGAVPVANVLSVEQGGTWAFGGLSPWAHYYVEAVASFGQPQGVAAIVGPLTVPSSGGPVAVEVKPAQITIVEQSAPGAPLQLQSAEAFLFDPSSGEAVQGATVTISVGGTAVPMPGASVGGGNYAYSASFPTPTPAQATYTITSTAPGAAQPASWQLVADPPSFTPSVTAPANLATVPANQPLNVTWAAEAAADEELVVLYASQANGGWSQVYGTPDDEDVTTETIPGSYMAPAGKPLLVNVSFLKGSCPATADGCVVGELIVPVEITPQ